MRVHKVSSLTFECECFRSQSHTFSPHLKENLHRRLPQSRRSQETSRCPMQISSSRAKIIHLLQTPPNRRGLSMLSSAKNTTSPPQCRQKQADWRRLKSALEGSKGNLKWSKTVSPSRTFAPTQMKGAARSRIQSSAWGPDQLDLEAASLSAHARYQAVCFYTRIILVQK